MTCILGGQYVGLPNVYRLLSLSVQRMYIVC